MKKPKTKTKTVDIGEDLHSELRAYCGRTGEKMGATAAKAISQYLNRRQAKK
jgi:hypothetical protein